MESEAEERLKKFLDYLEEGKKMFGCQLYPVFIFDGLSGIKGEIKAIAINNKEDA